MARIELGHINFAFSSNIYTIFFEIHLSRAWLFCSNLDYLVLKINFGFLKISN